MGIIDFVKNAGAMIFGSDKPKEPAVDPVEEQRRNEAAMAVKLERQVREHDLDVSDFRIEFRNGVAVVHGKTPSQAEKEKIVLAVGNVNGVAQVDDRLEVDEPEPEAQFYTVKRGDTLSKISKEFYGNAMKYPVIFEANRPLLKDPDKIYPGQVLRIPPQEG